MQKVALTVNGMRYTTRDLDEAFVAFANKQFTDAQLSLEEDNSAESLFIAYLKLADKYYKAEKEAESLLKKLESLKI